MAVFFVDGFEYEFPAASTGFSTANARIPLWTSYNTGTGSTIASETSVLPGSWSAGALRIADTSGSVATSVVHNLAPVSGQSRIVGTFRFRFVTSLPSTDLELFFIGAATGSAGRFIFQNSDNKLYAGFGGAEAVAVSAALSADTWYVLDFDWNATGNPNTLKARVNGANENTSSLGQASDTNSNIRIGATTAGNTGTWIIDDLVLTNTGTDYPLGEMKVYGLAPTGEGTPSNEGSFTQTGGTAGDWWTSVDSWGSGGGTFNSGEYIEQPTSGATDYIELTCEDLPSLGSDTVFGAGFAFTIWASTTNANTAKTWGYDGTTATEMFSGDCSDTAVRWQRWPALPAPGGGWSETLANGLRYRVGGGTLQPGNPRFGAAILMVAVKPASGPVDNQVPLTATAISFLGAGATNHTISVGRNVAHTSQQATFTGGTHALSIGASLTAQQVSFLGGAQATSTVFTHTAQQVTFTGGDHVALKVKLVELTAEAVTFTGGVHALSISASHTAQQVSFLGAVAAFSTVYAHTAQAVSFLGGDHVASHGYTVALVATEVTFSGGTHSTGFGIGHTASEVSFLGGDHVATEGGGVANNVPLEAPEILVEGANLQEFIFRNVPAEGAAATFAGGVSSVSVSIAAVGSAITIVGGSSPFVVGIQSVAPAVTFTGATISFHIVRALVAPQVTFSPGTAALAHGRMHTGSELAFAGASDIAILYQPPSLPARLILSEHRLTRLVVTDELLITLGQTGWGQPWGGPWGGFVGGGTGEPVIEEQTTRLDLAEVGEEHGL